MFELDITEFPIWFTYKRYSNSDEMGCHGVEFTSTSTVVNPAYAKEYPLLDRRSALLTPEYYRRYFNTLNFKVVRNFTTLPYSWQHYIVRQILSVGVQKREFAHALTAWMHEDLDVLVDNDTWLRALGKYVRERTEGPLSDHIDKFRRQAMEQKGLFMNMKKAQDLIEEVYDELDDEDRLWMPAPQRTKLKSV